jgi:hypothetical protein
MALPKSSKHGRNSPLVSWGTTARFAFRYFIPAEAA